MNLKQDMQIKMLQKMVFQQKQHLKNLNQYNFLY